MATKAWKDLSPTYRKRLERHGVTSKTHAVANKTEARGHPSKPPAGAAPAELVDRLLSGGGYPEEFETLETMFTWPSWVPRRVATTKYGGDEPVFVEVAAALSRLPNPRTWDHVEVEPAGDGEPWTLTVYRKGNAYPRSVLIPGGGQQFSGARQVLGILTEIGDESLAKESKRRRREAYSLFFDVYETP